MVLGIGLRSRSDRISSSKASETASEQENIRVHLEEIKPWPLALLYSSAPILQWSRGDKVYGSSKPVVHLTDLSQNAGAMSFQDALAIPPLWHKKRNTSGSRIYFKLLDAGSPKTQAFADGYMDFVTLLTSNTADGLRPHIISVPLTVSKKLTHHFKDISPCLYLSVSMAESQGQGDVETADTAMLDQNELPFHQPDNDMMTSGVPPHEMSKVQLKHGSTEQHSGLSDLSSSEGPYMMMTTVEQLQIESSSPYVSTAVNHSDITEADARPSPLVLEEPAIQTSICAKERISGTEEQPGNVMFEDCIGDEVPYTNQQPQCKPLEEISNNQNSAHSKEGPNRMLSRSPILLLRSFGKPGKCDTHESQFQGAFSNKEGEEKRHSCSDHEIQNRRPGTQEVECEMATQEEEMNFMAKDRQTIKDDLLKDKDLHDEQLILEDAKLEAAVAATKISAAEALVQYLQTQIDRLEGELRDVAAVEATLYSVTPKHESLCTKVHLPARTLFKLYTHVCKLFPEERSARCAKNIVDGLILVVKACGDAIPRLAFWWSNVVVLRELISMNLTTLSRGADIQTELASYGGLQQPFTPGAWGVQCNQMLQQDFDGACTSNERPQSRIFPAALGKMEAWIYSIIIEAAWTQVFDPFLKGSIDMGLMQTTCNKRDSCKSSYSGSKMSLVMEVGGGKQGSFFIKFWKKAFLQLHDSICPRRAAGVFCGCLPSLLKMVVWECATRLDIIMFNTILTKSGAISQTDLPLCDTHVLPTQTFCLNFSLGAQLKNVVTSLLTWLSILVSQHEECHSNGYVLEVYDRSLDLFPLLRATGNLLMVPKHTLADKALRQEVCPTLDFPFIERILANVKPDEMSPETVTPSLIGNINLEKADDKIQKHEASQSRCAGGMIYVPPQSQLMKQWIEQNLASAKFIAVDPWPKEDGNGLNRRQALLKEMWELISSSE